MTRIDHAKEARRALRAAAETPSDVETVADPWILSAQVHATLALVEQQRIANLIALRQGSLNPEMADAKAAGRVRMEGKDYVMRDGDIVEIAKSRISDEKTVGTFRKSAYQDVVEVSR